jgi:cyclopropane fatty-acyl-phospholipid synthase-like methyltransferase
MSEGSVYGRQWDAYVEQWGRGGLRWPGDEWGDSELWDRVFQQLFVPGGVDGWEKAVEIGPGSGKYTLRVLEHSPATLRAYDVSARFLEVCRERCAEHVASGRLILQELEGSRPDEMLSDLEPWRRKVDGFYSIDAMVHVDLQYLIAYLVTAAVVLKERGKLILTLANAASERGFDALLDCIWRHYPSQVNPLVAGKYEWLSPDLVESILPRLGFELDHLEANETEDVILLLASLTRPKPEHELERFILPPP